MSESMSKSSFAADAKSNLAVLPSSNFSYTFMFSLYLFSTFSFNLSSFFIVNLLSLLNRASCRVIRAYRLRVRHCRCLRARANRHILRRIRVVKLFFNYDKFVTVFLVVGNILQCLFRVCKTIAIVTVVFVVLPLVNNNKNFHCETSSPMISSLAYGRLSTIQSQK